MKWILCFIWWHDWERLKYLSESEILDGEDEGYDVDRSGPHYTEKVCLSFGKHVNEIEQFKSDFLLRKIKREKSRKKENDIIIAKVKK